MATVVTAAVIILLTGATFSEAQNRDYRLDRLDLLRMLAEKPWIGLGHHRWDRPPHVELDLGLGLQPRIPLQDPDDAKMVQVQDDERSYDDAIRASSGKRSAVATALNAGRRRRQPAPALGKAVTPYVGVGVLNDMGTFFESLRGNLETLASLSPEQRSSLFQEPPTVVHAPSSGGGSSGMRKLHALRPLHPTGNIRSYNRRSFVEADAVYPGANHHDPALLWTGLGR